MATPVVLLSHRKREFLETAIEQIRENVSGIGRIIVVDDSGDREHHDWLDDQHFDYRLSHSRGKNVGYLQAMNVVWEVAGNELSQSRAENVLLWEEDFMIERPVSVARMAAVLDAHPGLAQLNLQRQSVYRVEKVFGYLESHNRRGYGVRQQVLRDQDNPHPIPWISRHRPFTTNPGLLRGEILDQEWPTRQEADRVQGGAEPAMSLILEKLGYTFGWYGKWNTPYVKHVGTAMKSGIGY